MSKPEKTYSQENHFDRDLFVGQTDHMADLVDRLRLQIKEQWVAIIVKD